MAKGKTIKGNFRDISKSSIEKISTLIISAFALVAALAWNSAIQSVFAFFFGTASGVIVMIFYAVIVTVVAVIVTIYLSKLIEHK